MKKPRIPLARRNGLLALRVAIPLASLAFIAFDRLSDPALAAGALALAAVLPLALRPHDRRLLLAASALAACSTLGLVVFNGGAASPLVPLWLALGVSTALGNGFGGLVAAAVGLVAASPALIGGGLHAASTLGAALAILVLCAALTRSHAARIRALEEQVATDSLTGVRNRFALDRQIDEFLGVPHPRGALVFIDLDGFREINRIRGHAAGDLVLKAVSAALARSLRDDFVGRAGGDEFVLLLDRRRDPLALAQHLLRVIADAGPPGMKLTATAGVAYVPEDGSSPNAVRAAADQALRWGKADGKARAVRYDRQRAAASPEIGAQDVRRLWLEDRISIHVQPIVDLRLGRIRGYEALARFNVEGDNSPLRWFAVADRIGLRPQLELACFERSLRLFAQRPAGTYLSVNLSPDLLDLPVVHTSLEALPDLRGLVLELTEDAVIEDYERLGGLLAPHQARGLRIAVDDFGSGQANFRHAWSILPRYLKLDRALVSRLDSDDARRALVGSIVAYAEDVGAALIAEGVETTGELNALRNLGVPFAQGFRLAAPAPPWPAIDLESLLAPDNQLAVPSYDPDLLVVGSTETAGSLQQRFARNPNAMAAAVRDQEGRVVGLITRNRLLVTLGVRFGFALYGDRAALTVADLDFMSVRPGSNRDEVVAKAMARDEARRYDPILFLDGEGHLLGKLTIQELLEPGLRAADSQPLAHSNATDHGRDEEGAGEPWGRDGLVHPASRST